MNFTTPKIYLILVSVLLSTILSAQVNSWTPISHDRIDETKEIRLPPFEFGLFQIDTVSFKSLLETAPHEKDVHQNLTDPLLVALPNPDGEMIDFEIVAYDLMEPELAQKWDFLQNWRGWKVDDPTVTIRLDWTARGFHAMILEPGNFWFIDPLYWNPDEYYQSFYKKNYPRPTEVFTCHVDSDHSEEHIHHPVTRSFENGDCDLRTYRTAIACTGEYATFHGGTTSGAASAINTSLNRVNGVYETELAIRLILVANNNLLIYLNPNNDPYTNNNGFTMLGQNQANINSVIGTANYDIGHVYSTGGGGVASLRSPCVSNRKARGVTGRGAPVGDPFDIDYVAHEMGHQFGGNHTQNNSCNRVFAAAMEPGSASTIMGYAGICAPDVQNNSDAYYHGISLQEMANYMELGGGNSCATSAGISNSSPSGIDAGADVFIPKGTPFVLTATGSDPDGDPLTYGWEQFDNEYGEEMPPEGTNFQGPMFRSFSPTPAPSRYFPRLSDLVNNVDSDWEELPEVTRTMDFRVNARDFNGTYGCNTYDDVRLTVDSGVGPFEVNVPNTNVSWEEGQSYTVTWDVAGTDGGSVDCDFVDISLSMDGGFTYEISLATNVPNNGSSSVTLPNRTGTTARVMVKCSDNVFFDISDNNFTITQASTPLPLTWLDFRATAFTKAIHLDWSTADEYNTSAFDIERSENNREYISLGSMPSQNTIGEHAYQFIDNNAVPGIQYYYRIRQNDLDGQFTYSPVRTAKIKSSDTNIRIIPNPNNGQFKIQLPEDKTLRELTIYNALGQKVDINTITQSNYIDIEMNHSQTNGYFMIFIQWMDGTSAYQRFLSIR